MNYDPMTPIWLQVATQLKQQIVTGRLAPGDKLPGGRDLALRFEINPNTAARVYQELERGGVCRTRRGMGTYVTEDENVISALRNEMARETVRRFLKDNACAAGFSLPFTELSQLRSHFQEALYAAGHAAGQPDMFCPFDRVALSHTLAEIRDHMTVGLVHPAVSGLLAYDREHHTEFARTLQVYLAKERSQSRTADALHLHRNTLTYRLQRIRELLDCDPDDDDVRLHLLLSFRFLPSPA